METAKERKSSISQKIKQLFSKKSNNKKEAKNNGEDSSSSGSGSIGISSSSRENEIDWQKDEVSGLASKSL